MYLSYTSVRKAQVKITKVSTYLIHLKDFNSFPLANDFSLIVTSNKLMITMSASLVNNDVMKQRVKETNIKSIALHEESINHNGSST